MNTHSVVYAVIEQFDPFQDYTAEWDTLSHVSYLLMKSVGYRYGYTISTGPTTLDLTKPLNFGELP